MHPTINGKLLKGFKHSETIITLVFQKDHFGRGGKGGLETQDQGKEINQKSIDLVLGKRFID